MNSSPNIFFNIKDKGYDYSKPTSTVFSSRKVSLVSLIFLFHRKINLLYRNIDQCYRELLVMYIRT